MTLPASYREQRACANCRFVHWNGDAGYCALRYPILPETDHIEDFDTRFDIWNEWSTGRFVMPHGTCDEHEART